MHKAFLFRFSRIALALICASLAMTSSAASAEPTFTILPGFGGFFRPGDWTPIKVHVRNADSAAGKPYSIQGTLRAEVRPIEGDVTSYSCDAVITHQQSSIYTLYAKIPESRDCIVELLDEKGRRIWSKNIQSDLTELKRYQTLVVAPSNDQTGFWSPPVAPGGKRSIRLAYVPPQYLPDRGFGYESVDLVAMTRDLTLAMPDRNTQGALLDWIRDGGRLLAIGGINAPTYHGSFLEPALPVVLGESAEIEFESARDGTPMRFLTSDFEIKANAGVMWSHDDRPLAVRWRWGAGEVTYAGIAMDSGVAGDIPALISLWQSTVFAPGLGKEHPASETLVRNRTDFGFGRAASLPPILLIFGILGVYTALVGPINFYVLSKRRRLELAWITIPAIVIAFCAGTYLIGFWAKGGLTIVREMDVLRAAAGVEQARQEKLVSVFSPEKRYYDISLKSGQTGACGIWNWEYDGFWDEGWMQGGQGQRFQVAVNSPVAPSGWPLKIEQSRDGMAISKRLMAQWSSQTFQGNGKVDLGGVFSGQAALKDGRLDIDFSNDTNLPLRKAMILAGGRALYVGDIPPGGSLRRSLMALGDESADEDLGVPEDVRFKSLTKALTDSGVAGSLKTDRIPDSRADDEQYVSEFLRSKIWNAYANCPEFIPATLRPSLEPRVIGWLDAPGTGRRGVEIDAEPDRYAYGGMIAVSLPLRLAPGLFAIDENQSMTRMVDLEFGQFGAFRFQSDGGCEMEDCSAIFMCAPGIRDRAVEVSSIALSIGGRGEDQSQDVAISAFNFSTMRWDLKKVFTSSEVDMLGAQYANPIDGSVLIQLAAKPSEERNRGNDPFRLFSLKARFEGRIL